MTIDWNADWSETRAHWPALFAELELTGKPGLLFMEIGCFEGQSALTLLESVLTDPSSTLMMIDPLEFSEINGEDQLVRIMRHLGTYIESKQAQLFRGRSADVLTGRGEGTHPHRPIWLQDAFDLVYIDGDHYPAGVISDAVLTWPLLKPGGHLLFDDYVMELGGHRGPRPAIEAFADFYADFITEHRRVGVDQYLITKA